MKVDNKTIGPAAAKVDTGRTGKAESAGAQGLMKDVGAQSLTSKANLKGSSNVEVSERAQMMNKAKEIASRQTVDEAKVARLQKMIDEGKYKVDADKITDRLLEEHMTIPD